MRRIITNLGLVAGAALLLAACSGQVKGDGKVVTQKRQVSAFDQLTVSGNFVVTVNANQAMSSAIVKTDGNLQPYVLTSVKDKELAVTTKKGFTLDPTTPIQVVVNTKSIKKVKVLGKTVLVTHGQSGDSFDLEIDGMGTSILAGRVKSLSIDTKGIAHVNAGELKSDRAKVNVSGLGKVTVFARSKLSVYINGQGQVTYLGQPPIIDQEIYGEGKLIKGQ